MDIKCFFRKLSYTNLMIECIDPVGLGRLRVSESETDTCICPGVLRCPNQMPTRVPPACPEDEKGQDQKG